MKPATVCLVVIATVGTVCSGCSRLGKEGAGLVRGAKGVYAPIQPVAATKEERPLGGYTRFELGGFTDDFGGNVPSELLRLLPEEFEKQLAEKNLPNRPGGKTLLVRGRIVHYEADGMLGLAFGNFEEVVARVELVDKASGRVLGKANCIGRSKETLNRGLPKKAQGLAKAIASWIANRYPKE